MKKNRMKHIGIILAAIIAVAGLTACSQNAGANQENADEANAIYGKVTAINGNAITLALGTLNEGMPQGTPPAGQDGQAPQGTPPAGQDGQAPQGTPPAGQDGQMPQGTPPAGQDGQMPQGTPPAEGEGQGRQGGMLTLTGEEKTITVTDENVITLQESGSEKTGLDAVSVGSMLKVVYDKSDTDKITSIVVMGGGMPRRTGESTAAASPEAGGTASPQATETPAATGE